ncbi:MAG TPA: aspartate--tRNA ligase, partial [Planctomycetes bacterium]|nr:aspartate--tRNA ligase [Planctomycetota bacterium]
SRKDMDVLTERVRELGAGGLAWLKVAEDGSISGPVAKFFTGELAADVVGQTGAPAGGMIMMCAGKPSVVHKVLSTLRREVAEENGLVDHDRFVFHWVMDFPLFQYDEDEKRWVSEHHPFTCPNMEDVELIEKAPEKVRSLSYDLVINGFECASGSIRIHDSALQERIFRRLELSEADIRRRFGFFTQALSYGAPPHGGIALGVDRILALIRRSPSIRDVIAFPKTQKGQDIMSGAPSRVDEKQLRELFIASTAGNEPPG